MFPGSAGHIQLLTSESSDVGICHTRMCQPLLGQQQQNPTYTHVTRTANLISRPYVHLCASDNNYDRPDTTTTVRPNVHADHFEPFRTPESP
jgi:hypothetical protein